MAEFSACASTSSTSAKNERGKKGHIGILTQSFRFIGLARRGPSRFLYVKCAHAYYVYGSCVTGVYNNSVVCVWCTHDRWSVWVPFVLTRVHLYSLYYLLLLPLLLLHPSRLLDHWALDERGENVRGLEEKEK